jgi:formylglycine-generating enzyme
MPYQEGDTLKDQQGNTLLLFGLPKTEMIFVEPGSFTMGEGNNTTEITFNEGYFIGKYPVTQELYETVMGENPSYFKGKHRPVETVSWLDICEKQEKQESFLATLQKKIAKQYPELSAKFKLPSEAQWEYATRGGKRWNNPQLAYAGSQNIKDVAWYGDNSNNQTMPVGLKQANRLGLHDMSGNVWEWCEDWYDNDPKKIPKNGSPQSKKGTFRVLRGGCYFFQAENCRVAFRGNYDPDDRNFIIGFRLVFPQFY